VDAHVCPPPIKAGERRQVRSMPDNLFQADMKIGFADDGAPAVWQNLNLCTLTDQAGV